MNVAGVSPDPAHADPYRFIFATRGAANSRPARHVVVTHTGAQTGEQPRVVDEVVNWPTRRAILYLAAGPPDGSISDPIEYMRGVIDRTPEMAEGGLSVSLDLVPYTGLPDVEIPATGNATEFVDTHHYFTGGRTSTMVHVQRWKAGHAVRTS